MKTAPMMVYVLPRFRWFVWGFGLCAIVQGIADGYVSAGAPIMFILGVITYFPEAVNRRLIDNERTVGKL